jgi:two-component system CheB/CheR fusion protein
MPCDGGEKALNALNEGEFDLLISDVGMPGMDGYQLVDAVRRLPRYQTLPAIALTGFGRAGDTQRALQVGFDAHLGKPASMTELKKLLVQLGVKRVAR